MQAEKPMQDDTIEEAAEAEEFEADTGESPADRDEECPDDCDHEEE